MNDKTVLITGATSGIGLEMAKGIAQEGYKVIMACRNREKAEEIASMIKSFARNPNVKALPLDLASIASIKAFVELYSKEEEELYALINNAGVFCDRLERTEDGFEMTMGVNYIGTSLLTEKLLPIIKGAPSSRIITIASKAAFYARLTIHPGLFTGNTYGFKAYSRSKLAQILYTIGLAENLAPRGIAVNAVSPGRVATNIWNGRSLLMKIVRPIMMRTSISAKEGAQTGIHLATSPAVEGITGKVFEKKEILEYNKTCLNKELRRQLLALTYDVLPNN